MTSRTTENMPADAPTGEFRDDSYVSRSGHKGEEIPVASDQERIEDPTSLADQDSDAQLQRDDAEAIDKSNIIGSRTRGAQAASGTYREPGDEEGIPSADGTSSADVKEPEN